MAGALDESQIAADVNAAVAQRDSFQYRHAKGETVQDLVDVCLRRAATHGWLRELLVRLEMTAVDANSSPLKDAVLAVHGSLMEPSQGTPAEGETPAPGEAGTPRDRSAYGRAYALVIGISKYQKHNGADGKELASKAFTDLNFAADDARAVASFLEADERFKGNVLPVLTNEDATRRRIVGAFDELRKRRRQSPEDNPLVLLFFSGHGARDQDARHYLVPHDGERDELFATSLSNEEIDGFLAKLSTTRLTVFLDTCHAGAFAGAPGVKDGTSISCDPQKIVGAREGTYVIASCGEGQESREQDGHGIFTRHLLELLRCEEPVDFVDEEVDLWNLFSELKTRVAHVTDRRQEPLASPNIRPPTGIVITINRPLRRARLDKEHAYFRAIALQLTAAYPKYRERCLQAGLRCEPDQSAVISTRIEQLLYGLDFDPQLDHFYRVFKQCAASWKQGDKARLEKDCIDLHWSYEKCTSADRRSGVVPPSAAAIRIPVTPAAAATADLGAASASLDDYRPAAGLERRGAQWTTMPFSGRPRRQGERRWLSPDDVEYVRGCITDPRCILLANDLGAFLSQPDGIADGEFNDFVLSQHPDVDPQALRGVLQELGRRFKERWDRAKPKTLLAMMAEAPRHD